MNVRVAAATIAICAALSRPSPAAALLLPDGRTKTCLDASGAPVPETVSTTLGSAAYTSWSPDGVQIAIDPPVVERSLLASDRLVAELRARGIATPGTARARQIVMEALAYHECYHAHFRNSNEVDANCDMVLQLEALHELAPADVEYLGRYHENLGSLSPRYLGSGSAFWAATLRCVDRARASGQVPVWENLPARN